MDTVELRGQGFESFVAVNDHVKVGDLLLKVDLELLKAKGFETLTPIVIPNSSEYQAVEVVADQNVTQGAELLEIKA